MRSARFSRGFSDYQIKMGVYHAHHDSAHLDEYLPAAMVIVLKLSSL